MIKRLKRSLTSRNRQPILNEAVNFEKQVIFIAIPKTGTTSVRTQLRSEGEPLIPNPHLNIMQVRDSLYTYFLIRDLGQNRLFPSTGVPSDGDIRQRAADTFASWFKFSAVRNPWARAVSLYFRREGVRRYMGPLNEKMTFDDFCDRLIYASDTCQQPTLHKDQLDWICDENGHVAVDYVYKVEDFGSAVATIETMTEGRLKLKYAHSNRNPLSTSSNYKNMYSDTSRKLIATRFQRDIDYFEYSF